MISKLYRRSGISFLRLAANIGWELGSIFQVGTGPRYDELDVLFEQWPGIKLWGCEPHPKIVADIKNEYPGDLQEVAISDYEGTAKLYHKKRHIPGSSLFRIPDQPDAKSFDVRVTTMDRLWGDVQSDRMRLLWLDCEGSELQAFKGGERFLQRMDVINVELTAKGELGRCGGHETHFWLQERGWLRQWTHTQREHCGQVDAIYVRATYFDPDFCNCPCQVEKFHNS